jgi:hypothetical protein
MIEKIECNLFINLLKFLIRRKQNQNIVGQNGDIVFLMKLMFWIRVRDVITICQKLHSNKILNSSKFIRFYSFVIFALIVKSKPLFLFQCSQVYLQNHNYLIIKCWTKFRNQWMQVLNNNSIGIMLETE